MPDSESQRPGYSGYEMSHNVLTSYQEDNRYYLVYYGLNLENESRDGTYLNLATLGDELKSTKDVVYRLLELENNSLLSYNKSLNDRTFL